MLRTRLLRRLRRFIRRPEAIGFTTDEGQNLLKVLRLHENLTSLGPFRGADYPP
jgi:hypothetical protein